MYGGPDLTEDALNDFLTNQVFGKRNTGNDRKIIGRAEYWSDDAIMVTGDRRSIIGRDAYVAMGLGSAVEFDELVAQLKAREEKE